MFSPQTAHKLTVLRDSFLSLPGCSSRVMTRSTIEGRRGCNNFFPVLRGNSTKIAPTEDIFDQPPGGMSWIRGKLADHVGDHVVLSPGTESSYPRPPQSLIAIWISASACVFYPSQFWPLFLSRRHNPLCCLQYGCCSRSLQIKNLLPLTGSTLK